MLNSGLSPTNSLSLSLSLFLSLPLQMAVYGYTAYSAAKYGVRGLAEVLDMEVRCHNIAVSISYPPEVDTPMLQVGERERERREKRKIDCSLPPSLGRSGSPL